MTTLHKLSIRGVRSYAPDTESVIKFQHPLTIIVGANGSGKTSIIECLKYICSGEFPPLSDKGKSFVHDPDSCGEPIVKGQIKLAFRTSAEKNVIAIKSFQVTAQKGRRTFKLIDSVLSTTDDKGNQKTVSYKCARMDELMTQLMGVSTPVLENVVFCHQLDADWPLGDDKSLKKRFDDIFAATKYTRALETIKKFRADQVGKVKDLQRDLEILANNLETAQKIDSDKTRTSATLSSLDTKWQTANEQKETHSLALTSLTSELSEIDRFQARVEILYRDLQMMEQEVDQAHQRLQMEYSEETPELVARLGDFDQQLERRASKVAALETEVAKAITTEEKLSAEYQLAVKSAGRLELLQEHRAAKIKSCLALGVCCRLGEEGEALAPALALANQECQRVDQQLVARRALMTDTLRTIDCELADVDRQIADFAQTEQIEVRQVQLCQAELENLDVERSVAERRRTELLPIRAQAIGAQKELDDHTNEVAALRLDVEIERAQRQIQDVNLEISSVTQRLRALQSSGEARQRAAIAQQMYEQMLAKTQRMQDKARSIVSELVPGADNLVSTIPTLQAAADRLQSALTIAIQRHQQKQNELSQLDGQRHIIQQQILTSESSAAELQQQISSFNAGSLEQVEDTLATRRNEHGRLDNQLRNANEFANLLTMWMDEADEALRLSRPHACGLCDRPFAGNDLSLFVAHTRDRLHLLRSPAETAARRQTLETLQRRIDQLAGVAALITQRTRVVDDIAAHRARLDEIIADHALVSATTSDLGSDIAGTTSRLDQHRSALSELRPIRDALNELSQLKRDATSSSLSSSTDDDHELVQRRYEELQTKSLELAGRLDEFRQRERHHDQRARRIRDQVAGMRDDVGALERLERRLDDYRIRAGDVADRLARANDAATNAASSQIPLRRRRPTIVAHRQKTEAEAVSSLTKIQADITGAQDRHRELRTLADELATLAADCSALARTQVPVAVLDEQVGEARQRLRELQLSLQTQRQAISTFEGDRRSLIDNIEYRQRVNIRDDQKRKMMTAEKEDAAGHRRDRGIVCRELERTQAMVMEAERVTAACQGERGALLSQLRACEATLAEERYREIGVKHRHAIIDVETTQMMVTDLDRYYRALDLSLMEFHTIKMGEINQVLKELWQCTYRGQDIDSIAIRSDHAEGAADIGAGRQKKQYSYRLVMMQGDVELDMRGRSSAGQRILASLLIRLALSETFCARCGILALDEPTQNLDEANIRALADALNALIERRKGHENFQLILITHDEEFVELLRKRDNADCYWRVFKDAGNHSRIKRIPIHS